MYSVKIPVLSKEDECDCTVEATVVTGFEIVAGSECEQKLGTSATISRGRIVFQLPLESVAKVPKLRSIDNVYVVIYNNVTMDLEAEKDECMTRLVSIIPQCQWEKGLKVWKQLTNPEAEETLKFRVSCNRSNGPNPGGKHSFTSPEAATRFGAAVQDKFLWKPDMTNFDVEVVLNVVGSQVYVCLGLTKESLHRRNIVDFGWTTLRSTVAFNLLQMANIQDGDVVCDPMCGSGAIPIEGACDWTSCFHLAGDLHPASVIKTFNNRNHQQNKGSKPLNVGIFRWDVTQLPLRTNSVDVFVTDLPFGKRSGSRVDNRVLYPQVLREMARVSRNDRGRAVLLTHDRRTMMKSLQKTAQWWKPVKILTINLGGLVAGVYYLERKLNQEGGVCSRD